MVCVTAPIGAQVVQEAYIKASYLAEGEYFGQTVAISGNTMIVGARGESGGARGINGDEQRKTRPSSGAVFVYVRVGTEWVRQAYIKSSNSDQNDQFGCSVALEGDLMAVGAITEKSAARGIDGNQSDNSIQPGQSGQGAVYVFQRKDGAWTQQAYIKAPDFTHRGFGASVSLSRNKLLSGRLVYILQDGKWRLQSVLPKGAKGKIFNDRIATLWHEPVERTTAKGETVSVPAAFAYIYELSGDTWFEKARIGFPETGDTSMYHLDIFRDMIVIGLPTLRLGVDKLPLKEISLGGRLIPDSHYSGTVWVYERDGLQWKRKAELNGFLMKENSHPETFGDTVLVQEDLIAVANTRDSSNALGINGLGTNNLKTLSGAIHLFVRRGDQWQQTAYIKAHREWLGGQLGCSLAISEDTLVAGSMMDGSDAKGINGKSSREERLDSFGRVIPKEKWPKPRRGERPPGVTASGAAYIFRLDRSN